MERLETPEMAPAETNRINRGLGVLGSTDPRDVMSLTWKPHIFIEEGRRPLIPFFAKDTVRKTKMDSLTAIETLYTLNLCFGIVSGHVGFEFAVSAFVDDGRACDGNNRPIRVVTRVRDDRGGNDKDTATRAAVHCKRLCIQRLAEYDSEYWTQLAYPAARPARQTSKRANKRSIWPRPRPRPDGLVGSRRCYD